MAGITVGIKAGAVTATGVAAITTPVEKTRVSADQVPGAAAVERVATAAVPAGTVAPTIAGLAHTAVIASAGETVKAPQ